MFQVLLYFNRLYVLDATQYSAFIGARGGGGGDMMEVTFPLQFYIEIVRA